MADAPVVHIGENSPEEVAYKLLERVRKCEGKNIDNMDRVYVLNTYAECLHAVKGHRLFG